MKLTDMDIDCLEAVLERLELEDLVNAADSNKRLKHAARFVFARKYHQLSLNFFTNRYNETKTKYEIKIGYELGINDLKFGFQFLRCFGYQLYAINYTRGFISNEEHRCYTEYLNEFCGDTVELLIINNFNHPENVLSNFTRPFNRVELVRIIGARIDLHPSKDILLRLFPNMRVLDLSLRCSTFEKSVCISNHFPHLKSLRIGTPPGCYQSQCTNMIVSLLRLNPQLESFELPRFLECSMPSIIIQTMNAYNKCLETFEIDSSLILSSANYDGSIWHMEHVKRWISVAQPIDPYIIPFSFDQLNELRIRSANPFKDHFFDFCTRAPTLKILRIYNRFTDFNFLIDDSLKVTKYIPLLEELEVSDVEIDKAIDIIIAFNDHKLLKTFNFGLDCERQSIAYLRQRLINGWSIFSIYNYPFPDESVRRVKISLKR